MGQRTKTLVQRILFLWCAVSAGLLLAHATPDLPERLRNSEFWTLSEALSEPTQTFISDNLVSNEMSFAQVVPELTALPPGGVYLGVGPEQNFAFVAAMKARMAFIIDIRRENLLLHLMYKALFELSPNRTTFLSRLFSRPVLAEFKQEARAADLMEALERSSASSAAELEVNLEQLRTTLRDNLQLPLTSSDFSTIAKAYQAFHQHGPSIGYATTTLKKSVGLASYANIMKQVDSEGQELGFLASEARYRFVRDLQRRNLMVPVVGNFAGKSALRGIGTYLRDRSATVKAFYVSNVEDYLGRAPVPRNGEWAVFCGNVASLPLDEGSVFVRPLGLAAFDSDRRMMVSASMQIASKEFDVYPAGNAPVLKKALSRIKPEIANCG